MLNFISSIKSEETPLLTTWHAGCFHRKTEAIFSYDSLVTPQVEVNSLMNFDLAIWKGDLTSFKREPDINDLEDVEEFSNIRDELNLYDRNKIYNHAGNHCGGTSQIYKEYVDVKGEYSSTSGVITVNRPFPIVWLTEHDYYIDCGHSIFIMVTDRNDYEYPVGWANSPEVGGHGSGAISLQTWNAIQQVILTNIDKNIFIEIHQGLKDTTVGTGIWDGRDGNFHGQSGIPEWAGALVTIMDESTMTPSTANDEIKTWLSQNQNTVVAIHCVHTHHNIGETFRGRSFRHQLGDIECVNLAQINKHAGLVGFPKDRSSWRLQIFNDKIRYTRILHESITRNGIVYPKGFYYEDQFELPLKINI